MDSLKSNTGLEGKDLTIFVLKEKIKQFMKYDSERKEYYKSLIDDSVTKSQLRKQIKTLESEVVTLKLKYGKLQSEAQKLRQMSNLTSEEINEILQDPKGLSQKIINKKLREDLKTLRNDRDRLIFKLSQK